MKSASVAEVHILREPIQEDDNEAEKIDAALIEQGYLRPDVPLTYDLQDILQTTCETAGVPYAMALGLIKVESNFEITAVSPSGCYGLMQLNPNFFPADLPPAKNIVVGIEHLGGLLARYGDAGAALTAYNAGHDIGRRGYANRVMAAAERWA